MDLVQVAIQDRVVYYVTDAGWLFAWDRSTCLDSGRMEARLCWVRKASIGERVLSFASSPTGILTIESGVGRSHSYIVKRDFLNYVEKVKISRKRKLVPDCVDIDQIRPCPSLPVIELDKESTNWPTGWLLVGQGMMLRQITGFIGFDTCCVYNLLKEYGL